MPTDTTTDRHLANLLGALALGVTDRLTAALAQELGLGGHAPAAVLTIGARPARPIGHLSETLRLSHSATVRLVDRLADEGWVQREAGHDERERMLSLTPAGRGAFRRLLRRRRDLLGGLVADLDRRRRGQLLDLARHLLGGLPEDRADARHLCRLCDHAGCPDPGCPVGGAVRDG